MNSPMINLGKSRGLIALDGDGVLVDYRPTYPLVWQRAFGESLTVVNPRAYHAANMYGVGFRDDEHKAAFFKHFTEDVWETLPALAGAIDACEQLLEAGYDLVCVTAMPPEFAAARQRNFDRMGIPVKKVIPTGRSGLGNVKAPALNALKPIALVDDLADNFIGLDAGIHCALIDSGADDAPARHTDPAAAHSVHQTLLEFVDWWLRNKHRVPG